MNDKKTNKGLLWLSFLLALIILLLSNALSWLTDSDYNMFLSVVPYKWQLTIFLMLTVSLIFALIYTNIFRLNESNNNSSLTSSSLKTEKQQDEELKIKREKLMKNLSPSELSILWLFVHAGSKSYVLQKSDGSVLSLRKNGILYTPNLIRIDNTETAFLLRDWAWEYLQEHKGELFKRI